MGRSKLAVGAHVAPEHPLQDAGALGADCIQIFLSDPQGWKKPPARADAEELRRSGLPLYVHAPYLINVCSPKNNIRYGSRKILQQTCEAAADVGAIAVIVHPGHAEDGIEAGIGRWARTLEMLESRIPLYIENTAGGDNAVARRFDALARLWEVVSSANSDVARGFCFDTCHAHAAGYDLSGPQTATAVLDELFAVLGERVALVHANDCAEPLGTRRDHHASIGAGQIGMAGFAAILGHPGLADLPVVIETPGTKSERAADVARLRAMPAAALGGAGSGVTRPAP
jgi:deoxyribonuclease-4